MRELPLKNVLSAAGATLSERFGAQVVSRCADAATEYKHIRDAVGLTDFSHIQAFRIPEEKAIDFLDTLVAGNVAKTRYGRVLHTLIANDNGELCADCYVANNDTEFILLCESIVDDAALRALVMDSGGADAGVVDLNADHAILSVDGYKAWAVIKELFGADVLGLPYLSIENYEFEGETIRLFRAGKTSEFGYTLLVPARIAESFFDKLTTLVKAQGGGLCGVDIHSELRLEGRFFNIYAEGVRAKDPLQLGLQWMIDFDKGAFRGSEAIIARRSAGIKEKIIGLRTESAAQKLDIGSEIYAGSEKVATITASCLSHVLGCRVGLALFPVSIAFAGLSFSLGKDGPAVQTISMPPIMPRSLTVKLDEM